MLRAGADFLFIWEGLAFVRPAPAITPAPAPLFVAINFAALQPPPSARQSGVFGLRGSAQSRLEFVSSQHTTCATSALSHARLSRFAPNSNNIRYTPKAKVSSGH
jgi:hypothetical protein